MNVKEESMPQSNGNGGAQLIGAGQAPGTTRGIQDDATSNLNAKSGITADEIALYDRQIRLWGVESQEKIRTANVLLIGMKGLANEVAKNLVLAGIGALTIVDDGVVTEDDLAAQFFLREEHIGMSRAQAALSQVAELNPRVAINVASLAALFADTTVFLAYNLVITTDMSLSDVSTINAACRVQGVRFYAAATYGMYGYIFADLITHDFIISREKPNVPTKIAPETATRSIVTVSASKSSDGKLTEMVTKRETYIPILLANTSPLPAWHLSSRRRKLNVTPILSCLRALWEYQAQTGLSMPSQTSHDDLALFTTLATNKHKELQLPAETLRSEVLRMFLSNLGCEISPVCAFLGGQLAQDAINVIGGKEQPIQNMLIFDGEDFKAPIYTLTTDLMLGLQNETLPQIPIIGNGTDMPMMATAPLDPMAVGLAPIGMPSLPLPGVPNLPTSGLVDLPNPVVPSMAAPTDPSELAPAEPSVPTTGETTAPRNGDSGS